MRLYNIVTIIDRSREKFYAKICKEQEIPLSVTIMGSGTATRKHLDFYGLEPTEKAIIMSIVTEERRHALFDAAKERMFIDVPGNGVMAAVPLKSVGGGRTLAFLTNNALAEDGAPDLKDTYEMILVILNRGFTDDVMDAARGAGAKGGTVLHAKGTGASYAQKFLGVTLAEEKELILIAAQKEQRSAIMQAFLHHTGPESPAGAIAFSVPVTHITGIRNLNAE
ncbi:MAG: P-II family nitrogen regulator [Lachnospiraceae bacterium]|nr:P-II family nitrogen regulator [Lachnospiraceae bacterium]